MILIMKFFLDLGLVPINFRLKLVGIPLKIPVIDMLCTECSMNNVEDEAHLLMVCSGYTDLINHLIFRHLSKNVNISTPLFPQFSWLMSNEDEHLCKDIARFITSCCDPSFEQFC